MVEEYESMSVDELVSEHDRLENEYSERCKRVIDQYIINELDDVTEADSWSEVEDGHDIISFFADLSEIEDKLAQRGYRPDGTEYQ